MTPKRLAIIFGTVLFIIIQGWIIHTTFQAGRKYNPLAQYMDSGLPVCTDGHNVWQVEYAGKNKLRIVRSME